ncbi:MAG TPA: Fic/DOC family N-terminal domain-containing protein [Pirellulaceae bacterium]|nr:Fic/DOC family N-terminal domain-containing protein [Pirellulaceae bacterium]
MKRTAGIHRTTIVCGEKVRAFIPQVLPPQQPPLQITEDLQRLLSDAMGAIGRLEVAAAMIPSTGWFLYGFVRKEALVSSQIEGTQATLEDVLVHEATQQASRPDDVEEVCNYVDALAFARKTNKPETQKF